MKNIIKKTSIMDADGIRRALIRIAHEITEKNRGVENVALVGIRTRGVPLAARIAEEIQKIENVEVPVGSLDITLYRDDLTTMGYNPVIHGTEIDFDITGKHRSTERKSILILPGNILSWWTTCCIPDARSVPRWTPLLTWEDRIRSSWLSSLTADTGNCQSALIMQEKMFRLPVVRPLKWHCRKKGKRMK